RARHRRGRCDDRQRNPDPGASASRTGGVMSPVEVTRGDGPIVLGLPHTGLWLPDDALERLNDRGRALAGADWRIEELYAALAPGLTTVRATFHRYLIDANRDPGGASLYP